ncbi:MAG TPA: CHASE3 domain-containing protein [Polyangia bacterium]|nr:CHASE3 domain-containing protein [Polyangia bacterium]
MGVLVVPLLLLVVLAAALVAQVRALVDATEWIDHTDEVIATASRLERLCVDMETGVRGYLLMHDPVFRAPYEDARRELDPVLATLAALVSDNPPQRARVVTIRAAIGRWIPIAEAALARREEADWQVGVPAQREARERFEDLRRQFDALRAGEARLRDERTATARAAARRTTRVTIGAALLLGLGLALAGARLLGGVVRQYGALLDAERERSRALAALEVALRDLNADLEGQVRRRTADLSASNRELESFCYAVSHDLRSPLRGIAGFAQVLIDDYGPTIDAEGRRHLERVRSGALRMSQLIDDLLGLSRVTRSPLAKQLVDLGALAAAIVERRRADDETRSVDVVVTRPMLASGDARLLEIALENLVDNAWKYTRLTASPRIEIGVDGAATPAVYHVRDNGAGFDMAFAGKLFQPFQRLHSEAAFEGTGIGLATVQRVIERHGGVVWANATPGRGAEIFFTLEPRSET